MKNKPTRHKEKNVFKFKPFSERIADIDVDVFHRVSHRNEDDSGDSETYFYQALQKWNVLNLTESYSDFKMEVRDIITLPQLLNKKQHVVTTLIKYLRMKNILFLQPMLELVVAVARDLQKEFYEYFPEFLTVIIDLLQTKDSEQLEFSFTALAYLFKFLWRYLIKNVDTVFDLLLPLLADSQPPYINNFAAESFAFVVRKVKDKNAFLKLVLNALEDRPGGVPGCGKLLFEVIMGTPGMFHSCAEQMLLLYFGALDDEAVNQRLLYNVLEHIINCTLNTIHPQKSDVLWNVLLRSIDQFTEKHGTLRKLPGKESSLLCILRFLLQIIHHKDGRMLANPVPLVRKLIQVMDIIESDDEILQELVNISTAVLLAPGIKLMQETSSHLILKMLSIQNMELLYKIVEQLIHCSSFEMLVLPYILQNGIRSGFTDKTVRLFAKIIKEKTLPTLSGINLQKWKKFTLDIHTAPIDGTSYLQKKLNTLTEDQISNDVLRILMILPHLNPLPKEFEDMLLKGIISIYNKLLEFTDIYTIEQFDKLSFSFLLALDSAVHILESDAFYDFISKSDIKLLELGSKYKNKGSILNAIDLCLTHIAESRFSQHCINKETFDTLNECFAPLLGSSNHKVRLTVAHMYFLFNKIENLTISNEPTGRNVLELPYLAENEPATVHKYRERLLHLQALEFQGSVLSNLDPKYYDFPLHYLMGNLYINFSLLWDPVVKVISTYAHKKCTQFWPIFLSALTTESMIEDASDNSLLFECDVISTLVAQVLKSDDKPDYENYKLLLWKCMTNFSDYCEMKNRDLTGLLIDFVKNNVFKSNSEDAKSWNIEKRKEIIQMDDRLVDDSDEEEKDENVNKTDNQSNKFENTRNFKMKFLFAQLEIFSRMVNPKSLYREAEMYKIYLDLLSSKNAEIQKAALNCLLTYKHEYLLPYKEHLYNLVNEKSLKNELTRFKIDKENNMIKEEHRNGLVPILMRIIYGKMIMRTGMRTGGKAGGLARRAIILRFLAGSQEDEMMNFIKMAFKLFQKYVPLSSEEEVNLKELTRDIIHKVDLCNVIPPKHLQSSVNLLAIIIEQFGSKMTSKLLPCLLRILFCILAQVTGILKRSNDVHSGYLLSIKNIRTSCITILARFFLHYEDYEWTTPEIDVMFNVAVFPWLEKLPIEGIHSPTALLKLFMAWSQNSRYFLLFVKHQEDNLSMTPLPYIMSLLLGAKTHPSVINAIMEIIQKLLTLQDYGLTNDVFEMDVDVIVSPLTSVVTNILVDRTLSSKGINYGSTILLPHAPAVLEYMKRKLKKSDNGINKIESIVLSRISELVSDAQTSDTLLSLILPILVKKASASVSEEIVVELVGTIINLIKNVEKPEIHIRSIIPLMSVISSVSARKLLIQLFRTIAERSEEDHRDAMVQNCNILSELNAWDPKWIDQPDFQKRLDAFAEINTLIDKDAIVLEFGVAIIHNCYYFLNNEKDLALRDCSGQCLKRIGPKLAKMYKENNTNRRYLIDDTILTIVRNGIRSKNDVVRLQSIAFLGAMAMECPEVHPVLRDLFLLVNKADPEVDFFENMQHLQLHRKARALLKFCSIAKTLKKLPSPKTLTQFVLPLASSYLCNDAFANKNSIIDAAIETVGTVCRLLPWHQYEVILKYYLEKLRSSIGFQRQIIRIIVAILDSFHYDLLKYNTLKELEQSKDIASIQKNEELVSVAAKEENLIDESQLMEEKLDEALNIDIATSADKGEEKDSEDILTDLPAMQKQTVLSQSLAKRVVFGISKILLPQLQRSIMARTQHESSHKVNRKETGAEKEEEEIMRVPIALAMVKLLQKLPEGMLDENLPGIFMKLCTFLKSRLESVRRVTREILQKIMITLGPKYLRHLLREMNSLLTKGFQIHVLVYTIHAVLVSLKPFYRPLHVNQILQSVLSVCRIDLFGLTAEEKEISGIIKNVSEARSTKSFDIFHILAQFITESCLLDLIVPLKDVLVKTHSYKVVQKVVECLRQVVLGLVENTFIQTEQILIFLYGIISESIPELCSTRRSKQLTEKEARIIARQKPDCFIIPSEPKSRMGVKAVAKTSTGTNAYVIVEFGLRLYHILLKKERLLGPTFKSYLEPVVPILSDCLKSQHVKLSALALQCLNWILKMDLTSLKTSIDEICSSIFLILHKYAAAGLSKGDNFDLVMAAFKCMSVLIRHVKYFTISSDQLKILILYAEQDLHDSDKQATAFGLLRAIINRKLIVPEMHAAMEKVAMLSVTSELDHVRQQSCSVFFMFLMEYPLGKLLEKHISFYLTQLSYEMQPGRLNALEMIHRIVTGFPVKVLSEQSGFLFLMIGARLVNDDDPICRKLCAKCIKDMIVRIPHNSRNKLFDIVLLWLKDAKVSHKMLAAQLCGIFVTAEKDGFESRLSDALPLIVKQFQTDDANESVPGRFVRVHKDHENSTRTVNSNIKSPERIKDHHLFQVLQLLLKISANCLNFLKNDKYGNAVRSIAEYSQSLLGHPHLWVRLAASQLLGFILAAIDIDKVIDLLENPDKLDPEDGYIYSDPVNTLRSLILDLIAQLQPDMAFEELADQVVKNLVFVARVIKSVRSDGERFDEKNESKESDNNSVSLFWLVKRMRKVVNVELTQTPKSTCMRTAVFKWFAGAVATVPMECLKPMLFHMMVPLVREMSTIEETNAPLRRLAKEVATMIKKNLDSEQYARLLNDVQQKIDIRRTERKKIRSQQFVMDPEVAAKRKIARQQKKKEAKKRKMDSMKGRKAPRKRPRKEVDLDVL